MSETLTLIRTGAESITWVQRVKISRLDELRNVPARPIPAGRALRILQLRRCFAITLSTLVAQARDGPTAPRAKQMP